MYLALAVDTTAGFGSIALADETTTREEVPIHAPQGFSQVLFGEIESLLKRQNIALTDIDLLAGASGPGSFTGVRVGLATIKGLAEVLNKPAIAVSNLEALAAFGQSNARATIIDAHRGEIYAALYDGKGNQIIPESVLPREKFLAILPDQEIEWISQASDGPVPEHYKIVKAPQAIAAVIARIAMRKRCEGWPGDPAAIEANYVRRSDAELLWKER
jgi:tRNA threonylcarbamoyladenosine biosynthesis protein TsaB